MCFPMNKPYLFIIPLFALAFLLVSCTRGVQLPNGATGAPGGQTTAGSPSSMPAQPEPPKFDGKIMSGKHTVVIKTNKGDITVELDANAAPMTATNFWWLAKLGFYNGLSFHRIIPNFMIQGGDPNGDGTGGQSVFGPTFEDEINAKSYGLEKQTLKDLSQGQPLPPNLKGMENLTVEQFYEKQGYVYNEKLQSLPMKRGMLAMANRGPNTNGSQFFIITAAETPWLEGKHTVFGKVIAGMDVVDAITAVSRDPADKPLSPITYNMEIRN